MSDAGTSWSPGHYPLVNIQKTVENHHAINGKSKRLPGRVLFHFLRSIAPKAPWTCQPFETEKYPHSTSSHYHISRTSKNITWIAWISGNWWSGMNWCGWSQIFIGFSWHFPADFPDLTIPAINDATETLHTWPYEAPTDDLQELWDQNWSRTFAKRDASETLPVVTNYPW